MWNLSFSYTVGTPTQVGWNNSDPATDAAIAIYNPDQPNRWRWRWRLYRHVTEMTLQSLDAVCAFGRTEGRTERRQLPGRSNADPVASAAGAGASPLSRWRWRPPPCSQLLPERLKLPIETAVTRDMSGWGGQSP